MSIVIVARQKTCRWGIACPSLSDPVVSFAVEELRRYFQRISGCLLPVREGGNGGREIVVGLRGDLAQADRDLLPPPAAGHDGCALSIVARPRPRIVIGGGNARGTIYGVYDLLERMGCRFFHPRHDPKDPEVVPRTSMIRLAPVSRSVGSPIAYRVYNGSHWFSDIEPRGAIEQIDHAMKCRYNGMGWQCAQNRPVIEQYRDLTASGVIGELRKRGMFLHGPAHSFSLFMPNEHFGSHPEWFGLRDGARRPQVPGGSQFCWSNPEARKVLVDNVERFVLAAPEVKILCTLGFDGGRCCECGECAKSNPSNLVIRMMNELVERLAGSAPGVRVETSGGYSPVHEPPREPAPHPALRVIWAHWGRNHEMGYDHPCYGWRENLDAWRGFMGNRITLCQYYADNFASPWVAAPYAVAMESDRRYLLEHGIDGWYMLIYPRGYWWNHNLNVYLGGRCFYETDLDPIAVIRDYALRYFGPTAGPRMAAYYEQWAREPRLAYRVKDFAEDYDRAVLAAQRRSWIDPAMRTAAHDPVYAYRVAKAGKLHAFAERAAEMWRQREEIRGLRLRGKFEAATRRIEESVVYTDELLGFLHELADLDQGLVDKNEIPGFMRLKIKQWIDEERDALEAGSRTAGKDRTEEPDSMAQLPAEVLAQQEDAGT